MLNKVMLIGNLGRDPELKASNSGLSICSFSLATTKKIKGEKYTTWHNIKAFGKIAEVINKYCSKGSQLYVEGRIDNGSFEKDGVKKYFTQVICESIQFIKTDSKGIAEGGTQEYQTGFSDIGDVPTNNKNIKEQLDVFSSDDIPF